MNRNLKGAKTRKTRLVEAAEPATVMSLAIMAISTGILLMGSAQTQFLGACLVAAGIALVLLHYYTGL